MKITLEQHGTVATIEVAEDCLDVGEVIEELIIPAMVSVGFDKDEVEEVMGEYCDCGACEAGDVCNSCGNSFDDCVCH